MPVNLDLKAIRQHMEKRRKGQQKDGTSDSNTATVTSTADDLNPSRKKDPVKMTNQSFYGTDK